MPLVIHTVVIPFSYQEIQGGIPSKTDASGCTCTIKMIMIMYSSFQVVLLSIDGISCGNFSTSI